MFKIWGYFLLLLTQAWAYIRNLPNTKLVKKFSKTVSSVWVYGSQQYRSMSLQLLKDFGKFTPSRLFRQHSILHTMMERNTLHEDSKVSLQRESSGSWGFHYDHDDEKPDISIVDKMRKIYSNTLTKSPELASKEQQKRIEFLEDDRYGYDFNLDCLWEWENEEILYAKKIEHRVDSTDEYSSSHQDPAQVLLLYRTCFKLFESSHLSRILVAEGGLVPEAASEVTLVPPLPAASA